MAHHYQEDATTTVKGNTMIERIRVLDPEAAEYIENEAPVLESYDKNGITLLGLFLFSETPQGFEYWNNLNERLFYEGDKRCPYCGKMILI